MKKKEKEKENEGKEKEKVKEEKLLLPRLTHDFDGCVNVKLT